MVGPRPDGPILDLKIPDKKQTILDVSWVGSRRPTRETEVPFMFPLKLDLVKRPSNDGSFP